MTTKEALNSRSAGVSSNPMPALDENRSELRETDTTSA